VSIPLQAQENIPSEIEPGIDLPNPLGIGMTFYNQNQPYQTESLYVEVPGLDQGLLQGLAVENETTTLHLRLDYWLMPFINVFGIVGSIDSSTEVALSSVDLGMPMSLNDLKISMDGTVYGGGLVLAYGTRKVFGTLAYQLTETSLNEANSSVSAWVLTPKAGLRFKRGAAWVGGMYQNAEENHAGIHDIEGVGKVSYEVQLREQAPWNFVVGGTYGFSKHWLLTAQAGLGDRMSALGMVEYRF
jgi:predicted porin